MRPTFADLVERAGALAAGGRRLLGLCGAPGAGKSTLAAALVDALGPRAALVGMDGFHLAQRVLEDHGSTARKGAPDTFDSDGYVDLLARLKARTDNIIYAPEFRRDLEEPVACAVPVPASVPLVVTEGNYLLLWPRARALLDEVWFLDPGEEVRRARLHRRHVDFGRTDAEAWERVDGSDGANAALVGTTAHLADLRITL